MKSIVPCLLVVLATSTPTLAGDCYGNGVQAVVVPHQYSQVLMLSQSVQPTAYLSSQQLAIVESRYQVVNRPQRLILRNVQKQQRARNIVIQRRGLFGLRSRIIVD